jgi:ribosomal-protein-alanine N-acetyltransferase
MLIRAAVPEDIPQIMNLSQRSETAAHWNEREYDALFAPEAPKRMALVAAAEAHPASAVAFIVALCASDDWEIENIVVDPGRRRQGIGMLLLRELLSQARQQGAASLLLEVRESNLAAQELYKAAGVREIGRRPRYYRDPDEDAVLLRLSLS